MVAILVIQFEEEREMVQRFFDGLVFDYTILNHADSIRKVEGLRFTQVWFTPEVMISGMDRDLFDLLHGSIVRMSTHPNKAFRLLA
jgi:hypothetical protein